MPWVNLDDAFPEHPKMDGLSDSAFRLHLSAICYAHRHLTDGFIEVARVPRLVPRYRKGALQELLHSQVWHLGDGGYQIHDFLDWNDSRAKIEERRRRNSEAGKKGMKVRWGA